MKNIPEWLAVTGAAAGALFAVYRIVNLISGMISKDRLQQKDIDTLKAENTALKAKVEVLEKNEALVQRDISDLKKGQVKLEEQVNELSSDHVKMDKLLAEIVFVTKNTNAAVERIEMQNNTQLN